MMLYMWFSMTTKIKWKIFGEDKYMTILLKEGKKDFINDSKTLIAKAESKGIMLTFEEPKDTVSLNHLLIL